MTTCHDTCILCESEMKSVQNLVVNNDQKRDTDAMSFLRIIFQQSSFNDPNESTTNAGQFCFISSLHSIDDIRGNVNGYRPHPPVRSTFFWNKPVNAHSASPVVDDRYVLWKKRLNIDRRPLSKLDHLVLPLFDEILTCKNYLSYTPAPLRQREKWVT